MGRELRYYCIGEEELVELLAAQLELLALQSGGVNSWEWAGESTKDFLTAHVRRRKENSKSHLYHPSLLFKPLFSGL